MQLTKIRHTNFLLQVPDCPLELLKFYYSYTYIEHGQNKISMILESSVSHNPSTAFKEDPSYLCYEMKILGELVVGLYLLHEQKEKFAHLTHKFTYKFLKKLFVKTYGKRHKFSKSCLALTEDELLDPLKFLEKVDNAISIMEWFEFFERCEENSLAFGHEPYWESIEKQTAYTYYLPKLHDLGYLIANSEIEHDTSNLQG